MGNNSSKNKIFRENEYYTIREFDNADNPTLDVLFNSLKRDKGITIKTLSSFLGLQTEQDFDKGILSIFAQKGIISLSELKSLYFLFKFNGYKSRVYKKKFIAELLFKGKNEISYEDYFYNSGRTC